MLPCEFQGGEIEKAIKHTWGEQKMGKRERVLHVVSCLFNAFENKCPLCRLGEFRLQSLWRKQGLHKRHNSFDKILHVFYQMFCTQDFLVSSCLDFSALSFS